jgi:hypothetical protein
VSWQNHGGRLISQIGYFGDLSDDLSAIQQTNIIADWFHVSYNYLCRPTDVKPKLKGAVDTQPISPVVEASASLRQKAGAT